MNPLKGASPVPGPIMITGVPGLLGSLNCDLLTYTGTRGYSTLTSSSSLASASSMMAGGTLSLSQVVATPLLVRPVLVSYSTTTPQIWTLVG